MMLPNGSLMIALILGLAVVYWLSNKRVDTLKAETMHELERVHDWQEEFVSQLRAKFMAIEQPPPAPPVNRMIPPGAMSPQMPNMPPMPPAGFPYMPSNNSPPPVPPPSSEGLAMSPRFGMTQPTRSIEPMSAASTAPSGKLPDFQTTVATRQGLTRAGGR